ncbi:protein phosphatase 2C domain-containing protein [Candidatus Uhrbacteria bacterium]|nr:protein phosphatase 2C domain-containing protein [Candidatus Uhrbacteria bacterium]
MSIAMAVALESTPRGMHSEDCSLVLPECGVFAVFDGLGGVTDGHIAAEIARDCIAASASHLPAVLGQETMCEIISTMLHEATKAVYAHAVEHGNDAATTASVCVLSQTAEGGVIAGIGNVGDSRVYTIDSRGVLEQVTLDDGPIRCYAGLSEPEMRKLQKRLNNAVNAEALTRNEQRWFAERHMMSQVLGDKEITPRISMLTVQDGWTIILTTDGIHDNLTDDEMGEILCGTPHPNVAARILITRAEERSREFGFRAHRDDMTVIVIGFGNRTNAELTSVISEGVSASRDSGRLKKVE